MHPLFALDTGMDTALGNGHALMRLGCAYYCGIIVESYKLGCQQWAQSKEHVKKRLCYA